MISEENFYGEVTISQRKIEAILQKTPVKNHQLPHYLTSLLGPSRTWKIFRKQQEAIEFVRNRGCGLMAFAFEHSGGQRAFLACHPIVFWFRYSQRQAKDKCTYEIIQENSLCKLYLDIEFEYEFNCDKTFANGEEMLGTFLKILEQFLCENLSLHCKEDWFLDLDSSTRSKFSRHVILNIPHHAFACNFSVGNVVKAICSLITDHLQRSPEKDLYGIPLERVRELFISDRKGLKKLFIDQGVYTKNRHFRILESTKANKNAPLIVSKCNKFKPAHSEPHGMFLASLITFFDESDNLKIVEYGCRPVFEPKSTIHTRKSVQYTSTSAFDSFINTIIAPYGKIRKIFQKDCKIQYDIANYRYCENIGREHKSNNISLVIDCEHLTVHQTCYDPDCKGFISQSKPLPPELCIGDDDATLVDIFDLCDSDLVNFFENDSNLLIPDMNITDDEFLMIADITDGVELIN